MKQNSRILDFVVNSKYVVATEMMWSDAVFNIFLNFI